MRIHRTARERDFTIYGNELLRDHSISWCAMGLLAYLLSLPQQVTTDIRRLAKLRREGRDRIGSALRELEEAGYLRRLVHSDPATGQHSTTYELFDAPPCERAERNPASGDPGALPSGESTREQEPPSPPPVAPVVPDEERPAVSLLASLVRRDPRLVLSTTEALKLAPLVAEWQETGVGDEAVCAALTNGLPPQVRSPRAFLAHRLRNKRPERPPAAPPPRGPLPECEVCRDPIPAPGRCRACARPPARSPLPAGTAAPPPRGMASVRAAWHAARYRTKDPAEPIRAAPA